MSLQPIEAVIQLPPKLIGVFDGTARYRGAYGGRGSGKTASFALMTAVRGYQFGASGQAGQILCTREHLNSLDESSLEEVKAAIWRHDWLREYYEIGEKFIRSRDGRIKYTFAGLRHNLDSIKSKARILLNWTDEAESVSGNAYRKLIPTVREADSEIWVTWNPESEESETDRRFRQDAPADSKIVELNWRDNPWFPDVLDAERQEDQRRDPDYYDHIWEGGYLTRTDAQIFAGKVRVEEFEPGNHWEPYYGIDWGFSQDPTAAVECYVHDGCLWIRREAGRVKLELVDTPDFLRDRLPGIERWIAYADSARPESISHVNRHGLPRVKPAAKWPGSVEDGIAHMRSYREIICHPECEQSAREFRLYSYKTDRSTGAVLNAILDRDNHYIDAIRYALGPKIQARQGPRVRVL